MATVIRIKRHRVENPIEALLISCKRRRNQDLNETNKDEEISELTSIIKFAGTVNSKELGVSQHVRDAIRKEKLEREYKQHQVLQSDILQLSRQHRRQSTNANRYKVITSHRAINLTDLDSSETLNQLGSDVNSTQSHQNNGVKDRLCSGHSDPETNGHVHRTRDKNGHKCKSDVNGVSTYSVPFSRGDGSQQNTAASDSEDSDQQTDNTFCLIDVEQEGSFPQNSALSVSSSSSEITCNSVPMIREKVQLGGSSRGEEEYVYDLYYTNSYDFDFHFLENIFTVEALQQEQEFVNGDDDEYEEVYDDDDDSNDESNWRNDYPDEDPRFFENDDADIYYRDDMQEFDAEEAQEEDLAIWMSSRCNIEDGHDLSSDEEDFVYGHGLPVARGLYHSHVRPDTEEYNNTIEEEDEDEEVEQQHAYD
ncbi:hypothetical protein CHS0354_042841 [Potamilus streckersoni]|uniref:Probable RNA polymerase II nuclear localization protein SLC7A6OS n=1 Tax=Potamilus streckersoni TaxID=2493646 RepID=A0AAE0T4X6_9BIVA|nr:hypothetical protein CHS0354_042841 [Potamilus streckersoni]